MIKAGDIIGDREVVRVETTKRRSGKNLKTVIYRYPNRNPNVLFRGEYRDFERVKRRP